MDKRHDQQYNQQQKKTSGNAEHVETMSHTDAECDGDGDDDSDSNDDSDDDGDGDGDVESAETRSLNWAEPLHEGEQQGKSKKRQ
ncbi:MAG: hypothetical protein M1840_001729 [Geoglossum simile]|nr:MAG: hypothetical protein M1840_001729 [Geoglossum simile]